MIHYEWLVNLDQLLGAGEFRLTGFPLKIKNGTGSPCRVVAEPRLGMCDLHHHTATPSGEDEFHLDTPLIRDFIARVRACIAAGATPRAACAAIEPHFASLLARDGWLSEQFSGPNPDSGMGGGIGQWLLFRAGDGTLSLFSLVVPPGEQTPIHDHLAWGLIGLYRGEQEEDVFDADESGIEARPDAARAARRPLQPVPAAR